ncbi:unnamed protein product [Mytilus coruscus]|uniref:Tc1-like transposase DDE domain-containing protein n=1 Tax=Mytilus coruscus TaxID=42192 RepID=A0A6J8BHB6_MYTCO|nr:unnamed protein product [Mytilus coruscus]
MPSLSTHHNNLEIIALYRQSWPVHAIVNKLAARGIDVTWGTVKHVIKRYQSGKIGYRLLADKGTHTSKSTVKKVIKAAGYTASSPRYGQMVREPNKLKRVLFSKAVIADNDNFDNIIFTDECSVQLHDNKVIIYREKDSVAPVLPKPKHPLKVHVWAGISRRGTTSILIFENIMTSAFYINSILATGLIPFINRVYPDTHRFQQDNDPKHTANATKDFMKQQNINWWDVWPAESPDFNPIEMVWSMMKSRLS